MKTILLVLSLFLLCGTSSAAHYVDDETGQRTPLMKAEDSGHFIIHVLIWNNDTGELEEGVQVTFANNFTYNTANDGSVCFDTANIVDVKNGYNVNVSCKYGSKIVIVNYGDAHSGLTFNEPDEVTAIEAFAALGFAAIAVGGGRYLLRRKKNTDHKGDNMTENETIDIRSKLVKDFGVRALIATMAMAGYIGICTIAVYRGDMSLLEDISTLFMPIIGAMIVFYFNGAAVRDASK